ncbi:MAG: hypothetical protein C4K49_10680 [Candidatus Thorarchaeota archaeon]|nr:MAG: hypothetical protein C4K49_10680 [Candidatus Thorarchaeota archaeon]
MRKNSHAKKQHRELVDVEAKLKKLESDILDPSVVNWMLRGGMRGIRERLLKVDYAVVRNVVDRVPLLNAIVKTRINQVLPFSVYVSEDRVKDGEKGFRVVPIVDENVDDEEVKQIREFIEQTGVVYSSEREDDFSDYLQMLVREIGTIDQIGTELQYNLGGDVAAFRLLDGATLKRTSEDYPKKDIRFVQVIDDKLIEEFNDNNLIFDYKNKRVDIRFRGYGYSDAEMAIDLITTLLFGYNHLRDQFVRDKIPRGFISVMGDIDSKGVTAIQQYWYSAMSGAGGQWALPILPSGKDGVGLDFKAIGTSNKEMEYHRGMMFLSSIICAVFAIDMAELGIKAEDSTSVIGANEIGPRIEASKDRGLDSLLMFISQHMNKIMRKTCWGKKYRFAFSGQEVKDQMKLTQIMQARLQTDLTINDILKKEGKEERKEDWANIILNPLVVQMVMSEKNAAAQKEAQEAQQNMFGNEMFGEQESGSSEGGVEQEEEESPEGEEGQAEQEEEVAKSQSDDWSTWRKKFAGRTREREIIR